MPYTFDMPFILQGRPMTIRVLLNGKKAGLEPVRNAIFAARENGNVEVRVTWETGDIEKTGQRRCPRRVFPDCGGRGRRNS